MNIILNKAGKRFNRDWIFRNFSFNFDQHIKYAITGPNGSGKSTLLQVIAGSMNLTNGDVQFYINSSQVSVEDVYKHVSIVAPYLEVIEEMTAEEFLKFHSIFKRLMLPINEILQLIGLEHTKAKQLRNFSSGMKQRIKLAQAIFSDTRILLLDEPCTNLDTSGYELYHRLIKEFCSSKLVIVSSNDVNEYSFCDQHINILDYKSSTLLAQ
jgi:ABC-type multidrug transport system ATPase subunit